MIRAWTEGIQVSVETFYVEHQSDPEQSRWVWAYRITIENASDDTVQLLRRHWIIKDGLDHVTEVEGDGVVGEQPVLAPGESHTYTSGSVMPTPIGTMEGAYTMRRAGGGLFEVAIPLFVLGRAETLN